MNITKPTIEITLDRYNELMRKEWVFDILKAGAEESNYTTSEEKRLFGIKDKGIDE